MIGCGRDYGGVEQIAFSVCRALAKQGDRLDFLSYYDIPPRTAREIESLNGNRYRVTRYSSNPFQFLREIFAFYALHMPYDIVYCNANHASMILYTMPVWFSRRVRLVFHSHVRDGAHRWLHRLFRIPLNWRCDLRIACSGQAADWMYGRTCPAQIVYNGIDADRFRFDSKVRNSLRSRYGVQNRLVIGHVGRLTPEKNHSFLLDVFAELLRREPSGMLVLIGDGELYNEIKTKINRMGLERAVLMLPFQPDIQNFYQMMDVFVMPSIAEGFCLTGIEALASGLPTFYADTIPDDLPVSDLIHYLSLSRSAGEWAEEILKAGTNSDRSIYFDRVRSSELTVSAMTEKIVGLLNEL